MHQRRATTAAGWMPSLPESAPNAFTLVAQCAPGSAQRAAGVIVVSMSPRTGMTLSDILHHALKQQLFTPQPPPRGVSAETAAWAEMSDALMSDESFVLVAPGMFTLRSLLPPGARPMAAVLPPAPVTPPPQLSDDELKARLIASPALRDEAEAMLRTPQFHRAAREARKAGDATILARHLRTLKPDGAMAQSPEVYLALANRDYPGAEVKALWEQHAAAAAQLGALGAERAARMAAEARAAAAEAREERMMERAVAMVQRAGLDPHRLLSAREPEAEQPDDAPPPDDFGLQDVLRSTATQPDDADAGGTAALMPAAADGADAGDVQPRAGEAEDVMAAPMPPSPPASQPDAAVDAVPEDDGRKRASSAPPAEEPPAKAARCDDDAGDDEPPHPEASAGGDGRADPAAVHVEVAVPPPLLLLPQSTPGDGSEAVVAAGDVAAAAAARATAARAPADAADAQAAAVDAAVAAALDAARRCSSPSRLQRVAAALSAFSASLAAANVALTHFPCSLGCDRACTSLSMLGQHWRMGRCFRDWEAREAVSGARAAADAVMDAAERGGELDEPDAAADDAGEPEVDEADEAAEAAEADGEAAAPGGELDEPDAAAEEDHAPDGDELEGEPEVDDAEDVDAEDDAGGVAASLENELAGPDAAAMEVDEEKEADDDAPDKLDAEPLDAPDKLDGSDADDAPDQPAEEEEEESDDVDEGDAPEELDDVEEVDEPDEVDEPAAAGDAAALQPADDAALEAAQAAKKARQQLLRLLRLMTAATAWTRAPSRSFTGGRGSTALATSARRSSSYRSRTMTPSRATPLLPSVRRHRHCRRWMRPLLPRMRCHYRRRMRACACAMPCCPSARGEAT